MKPDIAKLLGYEIKKELADRYFGYRKLIEEDKETFEREVRYCAITLEQKIGIDLARLYILLHDENLIHQFLKLTGLEEEIFYDPYLLESPTIRERVLKNIETHGFTRHRRFVNLVLTSYRTLEWHVEKYREQFGRLSEDLETIKEEIRIFYERNNLGNIMNLLRNIDSCAVTGSDFYNDAKAGSTEAYDKKMQLEPPPPLEQQLPIIPPLAPYDKIRKDLKKLAARAYELHQQWPELNT
jgi:DNA repair exonuclease SbcCD ATPase subunit